MSSSIPYMVLAAELLEIIPGLLIFIGCLVYYMRVRNGIAVTMLVGSGLTLVWALASVMLRMFFHLGNNQTSLYSSLQSIYIFGLMYISLLASLTFAIGFLLLMLKRAPAEKAMPLPPAMPPPWSE